MAQPPVQSPPDPVPSTDTPAAAQAPAGTQGNLPVFRSFHHNVIWHLWTVISVATAIVLIYLNFAGHIIAPELGRTKAETKAVLNILLFVAKGHEIAIVLSIANLARQLVQSALISKKGTILALVGAEQVTATPSVLISNGYTSALKYGLRYFSSSSQKESKTVRSRRRVVLTITGFLLLAAFLCATVGPSSAVLMIPAQHWFLQKTLTQEAIIKDWNSLSYSPFPDGAIRPGHPYIFISPLEIDGARNSTRTVYWNDTGSYWNSFGSGGETSNSASYYTQDLPRTTHVFDVFSRRVSVNTTTTLNRSLILDSERQWTGGTTFKTLMYDDVSYAGQGNITYKPTRRNIQSPTRFITTITAAATKTVCRRKQKLTCGGQRTPIISSTNTTQWCFEAAGKEGLPRTQLFKSQDLLLLFDPPKTAPRLGGRAAEVIQYASTDESLPRFHITEGPFRPPPAPQDFTDSILFVFEFAEDLVVCTNNASLTSATATFSGLLYNVNQAEYLSDLVYQSRNGTSFKKKSPSLLFRKGWLDYEHSLGEVESHSYNNSTYEYNGKAHKDYSTAFLNKTRSERGATQSVDLKLWAEKLVRSQNRRGNSIWQPLATGVGEDELKKINKKLEENDMAILTDIIDASAIEVVVGGPWITLLSLLDRSLSQYMVKHDKYSSAEPPKNPLPEGLFDAGSLIEKIDDYRFFVYSPVRAYHFFYGYKLASATSILAVVVLIVYMFVACCGSIWQLSRGGDVIIAWGSVPEYLLLGESTATELGRLGYADSGGKNKVRYECGVRVDRATDGDYYGIKLGDVEVSEASEVSGVPLK